jgi:lipopolysaccharide biosynthesis glycosyltransferase
MSDTITLLMDIVFSCDDSYAQHLGVAITSLLKTQKDPSSLKIHIISAIKSSELRKRLQRQADPFGIGLSWLVPPKWENRGFKISHHISLTSYFRLAIPRLLDKRISRALYLDCDLIVRKDLSPLWEIDLSNYAVAAVEEGAAPTWEWLCLPKGAGYFNAGVLLLNLDLWRKEKITKSLLDYSQKYPDRIKYWDQDVLNGVLYGKRLPLHPKWNCQASFFQPNYQRDRLLAHEVQEAMREPHVLHFNSPTKPWHFMNTHPLKSEYFTYLSASEWRGYTPPDFTLHNCLIKLRRSAENSVRRVFSNLGKLLGQHSV